MLFSSVLEKTGTERLRPSGDLAKLATVHNETTKGAKDAKTIQKTRKARGESDQPMAAQRRTLIGAARQLINRPKERSRDVTRKFLVLLNAFN